MKIISTSSRDNFIYKRLKIKNKLCLFHNFQELRKNNIEELIIQKSKNCKNNT